MIIADSLKQKSKNLKTIIKKTNFYKAMKKPVTSLFTQQSSESSIKIVTVENMNTLLLH